jgi:hypothetical protein
VNPCSSPNLSSPQHSYHLAQLRPPCAPRSASGWDCRFIIKVGQEARGGTRATQREAGEGGAVGRRRGGHFGAKARTSGFEHSGTITSRSAQQGRRKCSSPLFPLPATSPTADASPPRRPAHIFSPDFPLALPKTPTNLKYCEIKKTNILVSKINRKEVVQAKEPTSPFPF